MSSDATSKFISDFCQWADGLAVPRSARKKLPPALRRAMDHKLPSHDPYQRVVFRSICEDTSLRFDYQSDDVAVFTTCPRTDIDSMTTVFAGTSAPMWRGGWKRISRDESVRSIVEDFFWAASTYVLRSRFLNITAAIALAYGTDCTFQFSSESMEQTTGPDPYLPSTFTECAELFSRRMNTEVMRRSSENSRQRYCRTLIQYLNALDPQIHRMLYLYVRALRLRNAEFWEDAIISLDSVVEVAMKLVRERAKAASDHPGKAMISALQLSDRVDTMLGELQTWRNYFGAHPGEAGFWDFGEDYADAIDSMFLAVQQVVWAASRYEVRHRLVEPDAHDGWAAWFRHHAAILGPIIRFRVNPPIFTPLSSTPSLASRGSAH